MPGRAKDWTTNCGRGLATAFGLFIALTADLRAQLVNDGATRALSNVTNIINSGFVTVGTNGSFTLLVLSDHCLLSNSVAARIGLNATARSNEVRLASATARWTMSSDLLVGYRGPFNRLAVSNGAQVTSVSGSVGVDSTSATNNSVFVSGAGSTWSIAGGLVIGNLSGGNRFEVSDGGFVANGDATVGNLFFGGNQALVTGANSTWSNRDLTLGNSARDTQLLVSSGGRVLSRDSYLGNSAGGSNNLALVTGAGSLWNNQSNLYVGLNGRANRLIVGNSATVAAENMFVGFNSPSTNNRVTVDGGTLRVTNAARTGVLDVRRGTTVINAGVVEVDQLWVTNAAGRFELNGGTLITRGANLRDNGDPFFQIGTAAGAQPATWDVRAGASVMDLSTMAPDIGRDSSFNRMLITNGAVVTGGTAVLGEHPGANSNLLVLARAGSQWLNGACSLGATGAWNRVEVRDGAVMAGGRIFISFDPASTNNEALVTGAGSAWTNTSELRLGFAGGGNRFVITNGGLLVNFNSASIGYNASSGGNEMLVTGTGSVCSNFGPLHVGEAGSGNRLVITNGGLLVNQSTASIGFSPSSRTNEMLVTGDGSLCNTRLTLRVGESGSDSRLSIANGGRVEAGSGAIGPNTSSSNNQALVAGPGSLWRIQGDLVVGAGGAGNRLVIQDSGVVSAGSSVSLGASAASPGSRVTVDGGTLSVTNGFLNIFSGTNALLSGMVEVDSLSITNVTGAFQFNGGTLRTRAGTISAGAEFVIGDTGTTPAIWEVVGDSRLDNRLPASTRITNGVYRPTDYNPGDTFPAPAPPGPYDARLSTLTGTTANGDWSLYIVDDVASDGGSLNSWSLQIQTSTGMSTNAVFNTSLQVPEQGPASPYPATLPVAGLSGVITNLTVTLAELSHRFPGELDILLVGPGGQKVMLMSDAGSGSITNVTLIFDDDFPSRTTIVPPLIIGRSVAGSQLHLTSELAELFAPSGVIVGANPASTANRVMIDGGILRVTNASATATFEVRRGTNALNGGWMDLDRLVLTSGTGSFDFGGGTLVSRGTTNNNGRVFKVGNGADAAAFQLDGGTHLFVNGFEVANHATLTGHGTALGVLTVAPGGVLAPSNAASGFGTLTLGQSPVLQGTTRLKISRSASTLASDRIETPFAFNYSGALDVVLVPSAPPGVLAPGDRFQLFSAAIYSGSFSTLALPPLSPGLEWTNKLAVNGSIEVVAGRPKFASITLSGTNVFITGSNGAPNSPYTVLASTNVALPLSNWVSIATNQFNAGGGFTFTNAIAPGERQRFFQLRAP